MSAAPVAAAGASGAAKPGHGEDEDGAASDGLDERCSKYRKYELPCAAAEDAKRATQSIWTTMSVKTVVAMESRPDGNDAKDGSAVVYHYVSRKSVHADGRAGYIAALGELESFHNAVNKQSSCANTRAGAPHWKAIAFTSALAHGSTTFRGYVRALFAACCSGSPRSMPAPSSSAKRRRGGGGGDGGAKTVAAVPMRAKSAGKGATADATAALTAPCCTSWVHATAKEILATRPKYAPSDKTLLVQCMQAVARRYPGVQVFLVE